MHVPLTVEKTRINNQVSLQSTTIEHPEKRVFFPSH